MEPTGKTYTLLDNESKHLDPGMAESSKQVSRRELDGVVPASPMASTPIEGEQFPPSVLSPHAFSESASLTPSPQTWENEVDSSGQHLLQN